MSYLGVGSLDPQHHHPLAWVALAVPLNAVAAMVSRTLQSARRPAQAALPWRIGLPLLELALFGLVIGARGTLEIEEAVMIGVVATAAHVVVHVRTTVIVDSGLNLLLIPRSGMAVNAIETGKYDRHWRVASRGDDPCARRQERRFADRERRVPSISPGGSAGLCSTPTRPVQPPDPRRSSVRLPRLPSLVVLASLLLAFTPLSRTETLPAESFSALRWRLVGPLRGGWATCAEGLPGAPDTFYFGAADGGVWKTTNAGRSWNPVFEGQPAAAVGTLAIAPSDPATIYVGTGHVSPRWDVSDG
ncbi:MAG: hypothetical protein HC897_10165, partial [Thermoanaerobaculia bacterium]|nr:hypothetical protein [Thermoanaerobaculia bacterium]